MSLPQGRLRPTPKSAPLTMADICPPLMQTLISGILPVAASHFGIGTHDIVSRRRKHQFVKARAFVVWALRWPEPPLSYPAIAELLGGIDHTSAIYLHERAIQLRLADTDFAAACNRLTQTYQKLEEGCHERTSH